MEKEFALVGLVSQYDAEQYGQLAIWESKSNTHDKANTCAGSPGNTQGC